MKTPQKNYPKLAESLGVEEIHLKREDLNKYGSHKGRSIPLMIDKYLSDGFNNFVISSSGNAALAAIRKIEEIDADISLKVFIGRKISKEKEDKLRKEVKGVENIEIKKVERPKQAAFKLGKKENIIYLRQSTDDLALKGYKNLAKELAEIDNLQAVFVPTSSGTTAQGVFEGFQELDINPEIHIIQTEYCHPIAKKFDQDFEKKDNSTAKAIVDRIAHRKKEVIQAVESSGGSGWVINDKEINDAIKLVKQNADIEISNNSALSVAGAKKAIKNGWNWNGPIACLICGS